jgi:hypothetical protein
LRRSLLLAVREASMTKLITKHPVAALVLIWAALIGVISMP